MSEGQPQDPPAPSPENAQPGFCSATCTDKMGGRAQMKQPDLKTSDLFATCNLPKRFEHPHWFNGYGCQVSSQHPFYRTSSSEYGWYPPGYYSVPTVFFPAGQRFTNALSAAGMYRNYSLNTGMDPAGYHTLLAAPRQDECESVNRILRLASVFFAWLYTFALALSGSASARVYIVQPATSNDPSEDYLQNLLCNSYERTMYFMETSM